MAGVEVPILTKNGKTFTVRKWLGWIILVGAVISSLGNLFGYVIEPIMWKQSMQAAVKDNQERSIKNSKDIELLKAIVDDGNKVSENTRFNLERLMKDKFHMDWIERPPK